MKGRMRYMKFATRGILGVGIAILIAMFLSVSVAQAHPLSGDIKTTGLDGNAVQQNHFKGKCLVALNGGPDQPQAHHLPDGKYDVGVTDPSGNTVLGEGFGTVTITSGDGTFGPTSLCSLVQPSPYDTTPNNGGVYKVWLCYEGELFVNSHCKKSNFKVTEDAPPVVPPGEVPPGQPPTGGPLLPPPVEGPPGAPTPTQLVPTKLPTAGASVKNHSERLPTPLIGLAIFGIVLAFSGMGVAIKTRPR